MHTVVVGCGRVGATLARTLALGGRSVAVVDRDADAFRRLEGVEGIDTVVGWGFDRDDLEAAGVGRAAALAAVTSGDNSNIIAARIAREAYGVERVVARIYDPRRADVYSRLGIPTIATVRWSAEQVLRRLFPEEADVAWTDPTGRLSLVEEDLPAARVGRSLDDLLSEPDIRLVSLTRGGEPILAVPGLVGQHGDRLLLAVREGAVAHAALTRSVGHE